MTDVALVFPGQGTQTIGMGKEFYDTSPEAKKIFDSANAIIDDLTNVIFFGPSEKLTSTAYCQPAIFTYSMAALSALKAHTNFQKIEPQFAAGLSLGEYSAIAAAEALSFEDTLKLVERRSFFMEEATRLQKGAMAAVIGFDKEQLIQICARTGAEVANFNSPDQIVITGEAVKVTKASEEIRRQGAMRVIPLDVSGAFHSSLMQSASEKFKEELKKSNFKVAQFPIVCNVTGQIAGGTEDIRDNLAQQITSSVQWVKTIEYIAAQGIKTFLEIGPGNVLKGLIRKINRDLKVLSIKTPADIELIVKNI